MQFAGGCYYSNSVTFKAWIAHWYASSFSEGAFALIAAVCHKDANTSSDSSCARIRIYLQGKRW